MINIVKKLSLIYKFINIEVLVFASSLLIRLPTLGYDLINNDAYLWKDRSYVFGANLFSFNFVGTNVTYHPGVILLYLMAFANKIYTILQMLNIITNFTGSSEFFVNHFLQKFVVVVFISILISIIFYFLKKIVGIRLSLIFVLLLNLDPYFLLLSREIHTDAILTCTIFLSLVTFYLYFRKIPSNKIRKYFTLEFVISSIALSFALLTKSSAICVLIFYFFVIAFKYYKYKNYNYIKAFIIYVLLTLTLFIVFWPAMWVSPITTLNDYLFTGIKSIGVEEGHGHIWFGKETLDPGPLFYPIVILGRFSMEVVLLFFVSLYFLYRNRKNENTQVSKYLGLFALVYFIIITIASKKLDRYAEPILLPIIFIAIYELRKYIRHKSLPFIVALFLIYRGYLLYSLHPNYHVYYSPLVGGTESGIYLLEPKWLMGYDRIAKYFNSKKNPQNITVAIADYDYLRPFGVFKTVNINHDVEALNANYYVVPTYRTARNEYYRAKFDTNRPVESITVGGIVLYDIYEIKKP